MSRSDRDRRKRRDAIRRMERSKRSWRTKAITVRPKIADAAEIMLRALMALRCGSSECT